jgi:exodeoxyribonuclease V gamma subunit
LLRNMKPPAIFPHANLEALLDAVLGALSGVQGGRSPAGLKPVPVIIPSIQVTDWLQVAIAKRRGICMGLEFLMPQEFIERALSLVDKDRDDSWGRRNLTWRLLPHIRDYVEQLGVKDPSHRDRFALAGSLADQFDQYDHFRPEITANWSQGKTAAKSYWSATDKENEAWQRELWTKAQAEIAAMDKARSHPALLLDELAQKEGFLKSLNDAFPRLFVLGTGALDPLLVRLLRSLGEACCDVQVHVVLPSLGYLGEMRKAPRVVEQDPEEIALCDGHPLLVSMGRHAVGSFLLLGEMDDNYAHWPDPVPCNDEESPRSLLGRVQADIRQLRMPAASCIQSEEDISLRVHSCYGPRREMEVLRDELFRAFRDIEGLKPEEVLVVTPSLETYAPLVAAVLEQAPSLPVRLTELPPSEQDPMGESLLALLQMAGGRFEASALLELLQLRAVRACLGIPDDSAGLERVRDWVRQSGLTCKLDEEAAATTGSWRFARNRIISGKWFGWETCARYPDEDYVLPVADALGGDLTLKQAFIEWHWQLAQTFEEWKTEATPSVWSDRLGMACDQLLSKRGDDDSRLEIQHALTFLAGLDGTEPVDAAVIFDWLQSELEESGRRTPVSGRITFGRLKQLQNIPCRVLAMVGIQDGAFPRQNRVPAWDLLHCDPKAWDRNTRIDDRQLFLDAVLTPSERLIITASTRNVRSGKSEPFSSCVDELLRVVQTMTQDKRKLLIEHRLQPFAPNYFGSNRNGESLPGSFDANSARVAESFLKSTSQPRKGTPFWKPGDLVVKPESAETIEITLEDLVYFWKDPAKAFLWAQGIAPEFKEGNDEELDRTPLDLDSLQQWTVKTLIIRGMLEARSPLDYTKAQLLGDRGLPPSELGNLTWSSLHNAAEPLGKKVTELKPDFLLVDFLVPETTPPVKITGAILRGTSNEGPVLLAYRVGKFKSAKHYLEPWIQSIVAACAGHSLISCLVDEESLESPKLLGKQDRDQAEELLRHLLDGFSQGLSRPLCYAPETSDAYVSAAQDWESGPDEAGLENAAEEWSKDSSYGGKGEGFAPSARLAWRDQDPFEHKAAWHQWARAIANPLHAWFSPKE